MTKKVIVPQKTVVTKETRKPAGQDDEDDDKKPGWWLWATGVVGGVAAILLHNKSNNESDGNAKTDAPASPTSPDDSPSLPFADILGLNDNAGNITGNIARGGTSDDTNLVLTGSISAPLTARQSIKIFDNGILLGNATYDAPNNTWRYTDTRALKNGDHPSYTAQVYDSDGKQSAASAPYDIYILTQPPTTTAAVTGINDDVGIVTGNVANGGRTDDTRPDVSGTLDAALASGETVRVYDGTTFLGTATVDNANKTWTYSDTRTLNNGDSPSYTARVADAAGNQSAAGTPYTLTIDTTTPATTAAVTGVTDDVGAVQGNVANGGSTDDTRPEISGTLDAALASGETVRVYDGTTLLGTATVDNTNKTWTYSDTRTLNDGDSPAYTARVADAIGNQSAAGTAYGINIVTVGPTTKAAVTGVADDMGNVTGNVANGGSTDDTSPDVSGTLDAALASGETVHVYDGTTLLGTATVDSTNKTWAYSDTRTLNDGDSPAYTARVTDAAGNQSAAGTPYTVTIDTTAPTATAAVTGVTDDVGAVQGNVTSGGNTDDTSPEVSGTLDAALASGETVLVYDGPTFLGTATVDSSNKTWRYSDTRTLINGESPSYTARVADAAGNPSAAGTAYGINIVTVGPTTKAAVSGVADNVGSVTGNVANGGSTDDTRPDVSGTLSAALVSGETVQVYDGTTLLGTATVDSTNNSWTYSDTRTLSDGDSPSYTARVMDTTGNYHAGGTPYTVTIDTTAPTATAAVTGVTDDVGAVQGNVASGDSTDDTSPEVSGTLDAALASGETVHVYDGTTLLGTATVDNANKTWTYSDTRTLSDGDSPAYTARVADATGNQSAAGTPYTVTIDTTAPTATAAVTGVTDDVGAVQGNVASGDSTDDTGPEVSGTLDAALASDETVRVYDGSTFLGTATVDSTNKTWTYSDTRTLDDGDSPSYTARVADAAGNQSAAGTPYTVTIDTTTPTTTAAVTGVTDDVGRVTGNVANGGSTDDTRPEISGTLDAALASGETVRVYDGTTFLGTATVDNANKTWTYSDTRTLSDGDSPSYTARVADAAGNQSAAGTAYNVNIETADLPTTATITNAADDTGAVTGTVSTNSSTDDDSLVLSGTISAALKSGETLVIYDGTTKLGTATISQGTSWSYTASSLATATHSFTARVENSIGLNGPSSTALNTNVTGLSALSASDDVGVSTGAVTSGGTTDDATPTLSGTLTAALLSGEKVGIYSGTTRLGTATINAAGTGWEYTPTTDLSSGEHTFTAKVEKSDDSVLMTSAEFTLTVVPFQTVAITRVYDNAGGTQGNIADKGVTDDITPLISGTLSAALKTGETVVVYDVYNGITTRLGTATVDSSNPSALTWSLAIGPIAGGDHSFTARVESTSGQNGVTSSARELIVSGLTLDTFTDDIPTPNGPAFNLGDLPLNKPVRYVRVSGLTPERFGAGDIEVWAMVNGVRTNVALNKPSLTSSGGGNRLLNNGISGYGNIGYVSNPDGKAWFQIDLGANYHIDTISTKNSGYGNTQLNTVLSLSPTSMANYTNLELMWGNNQDVISYYRPGQTDRTYDFGNPAVVSDDNMPLLSGSISSALGPGQRVYVYSYGWRMGEATVDTTAQRWSFQVQTPLRNGNHGFTVKVESGSTKVLEADTINVRIIPSQTITITGAEDSGRNLVISDGGVGYDSTPTLTGTLSSALIPGEELVIYIGLTRRVITSVDNNALT